MTRWKEYIVNTLVKKMSHKINIHTELKERRFQDIANDISTFKRCSNAYLSLALSPHKDIEPLALTMPQNEHGIQRKRGGRKTLERFSLVAYHMPLS